MAVMTISSARAGSALRPSTGDSRSWSRNSPSRLPRTETAPSVLRRGAPLGARGMKEGATTARTRLTPGSRAMAPCSDDTACAPMPFGEYTETVMSDGLVLARKVGYEDCVRRPAAADAMATPPVIPTSSTKLRSAARR